MSDSDRYELHEASITTFEIGDHIIALIRAEYPDEPGLERRKWHAYCTEYFGDAVPREDRVRAVDTSFNVAAARAVDEYANSRSYSGGDST